MPIAWNSGLRQAQRAALEFCAFLTKSAIGVFEPTPDGRTKVVLPWRHFEPYCKKLQSFSQGARLCQEDHTARARQVMQRGQPELTLCHAGALNQALPIVVGGKVRAVLMYGQMKVQGDPRDAEALKRHEAVIARLELSEEEELDLRILYDEIRELTANDLAKLNEQLSALQRLFYATLSGEQESDRHTENIIHDLQTRLQPILSQAEELVEYLEENCQGCSKVPQLRPTADQLVCNIKTMRVPIWNLGNFMPEYHMGECSLKALVEESVVLYAAEAKRKNVTIRIELEEPSSISMSRVHLQQAVNNLVHNAIKYSYRGRYDLDRFVEIRGETDGFDYVLTFENYGVGLLPEEYGRIFEYGYKGALTHGEYRSGSGMGLAIVKEIIERHHGMIQVESRRMGEGQGDGHDPYLNKFVVRLPRMQYPSLEEQQR